jgi:hypothetical protein
MASAFVVNCRPHNWEACDRETIFGLKIGIGLPSLRKGDIILFRISGTNYGVKAIWYFEEAVSVGQSTVVPWSDSQYDWIIKCKPIVKLSRVFSEDFQTSSKKSTKISDLYAGGIIRSIVSLKPRQTRDYIQHILKEFQNELSVTFDYLGEEKVVKEFLEEFSNSLDLKDTAIKPQLLTPVETPTEVGVTEEEELDESEKEFGVPSIPKNKKPLLLYGIVGERIDLPILNYAPLNEKGVILLFGYYLQDLGISHVEEIKSGFPDAIAMQSIGNGRYKRIRIEFEYRSSSFLRHNHPVAECDVVVCWIHDWPDCPLEVIELSPALFQQDPSI